MTTVPEWASPLTRVKSPATRRRPSGSARRALTCALSRGLAGPVAGVHVEGGEAARGLLGAVLALLDAGELPPTYIVDPTCAKA